LSNFVYSIGYQILISKTTLAFNPMTTAITLKIADLTRYCVLNEEGAIVYDAVKPYLFTPDVRIEVDYTGTTAYSSSFYNSFLGRIVEEIGFEALKAKFKFLNLTNGQRASLVRYLSVYQNEPQANPATA